MQRPEGAGGGRRGVGRLHDLASKGCPWERGDVRELRRDWGRAGASAAVCTMKPMHSSSLLSGYQKLAWPTVLYSLLSLRARLTPNTPTFRSPCSFVPGPTLSLLKAFPVLFQVMSCAIDHSYQQTPSTHPHLRVHLAASSAPFLSSPTASPSQSCVHVLSSIPSSHSSGVLSLPSHSNGSYQGHQESKHPEPVASPLPSAGLTSQQHWATPLFPKHFVLLAACLVFLLCHWLLLPSLLAGSSSSVTQASLCRLAGLSSDTGFILLHAL